MSNVKCSRLQREVIFNNFITVLNLRFYSYLPDDIKHTPLFLWHVKRLLGKESSENLYQARYIYFMYRRYVYFLYRCSLTHYLTNVSSDLNLFCFLILVIRAWYLERAFNKVLCNVKRKLVIKLDMIFVNVCFVTIHHCNVSPWNLQINCQIFL